MNNSSGKENGTSLARQRGHVGEVWVGRSSLAIERHRNMARVLPKPGKFLENKKGRNTSHVPRGRDVAPPSPRGLTHGGKGVGSGRSLRHQDVQEFPLADVRRGGRGGEKKGTSGDHEVLRVNRVVADSRRWRNSKTYSGVTEFFVGPASGGPAAMTLLMHQAIMHQIAVEAFKPMGSSKRGLRGVKLKTSRVYQVLPGPRHLFPSAVEIPTYDYVDVPFQGE
jgi:hypothetical protein